MQALFFKIYILLLILDQFQTHVSTEQLRETINLDTAQIFLALSVIYFVVQDLCLQHTHMWQIAPCTKIAFYKACTLCHAL